MSIAIWTLAVTALAVQDLPGPAWKLDPEAAARGSRGHAYLVESPIGSGGSMVALNGADASVEIPLRSPSGAGAGDFSVSIWVCPIESRDASIASSGDASKGWELGALKDGSVRFRTSAGDGISSAARTLRLNHWYHVCVSVRRSGENRKSVLFVNGEPAGQGAIAEADLDSAGPLRLGRGWDPGGLFCGLADRLALYATALTAEQVARLADGGLPWARRGSRPRAPFDGTFSLEPNDVVAFVGGEDVVAAQEAGHLEAILSAAAKGKGVLFRSLAWEGDTVYEQPRLLNFGSWRDQLSRAGASVIVVQFGASEALEGKDGVERFGRAYDRLLQELSETTGRIVAVSPVPFEKPAPPLPDLSARQDDLRRYVDAMRQIAARRAAIFVDLFDAKLPGPLTRDGMHLSEFGHRAVAKEIAARLGVAGVDEPDALREAIRKKNRLWQAYWRPSNWAFLSGDRIEQPSSRDHVDKRVRWFPVEIEQALALVRREDAAVEKLLGGTR